MAKCAASDEFGAIAQLGERLHGMQEVGGSIPPGSTIYQTGRIASDFFMLAHYTFICRHHGGEGYPFCRAPAIAN